MTPRRRDALLVAALAVAIWSFAPVVPLLRRSLGAGGFERIVSAGLALAGLGLAGGVLVRAARRSRWHLLAGALVPAVGAAGYGLLAAPDPRSRLVELTHLVEYGLLGGLAFRVGLVAEGGSLGGRVLAGLAAGVGVGLVDESLQFALAARYAEIRDVLVDAWAAVVGASLVAAVGAEGGRLRPRASEIAVAAPWAVVLVLAVGLFLHGVHLARWVEWDGIAFRSRFAASELDRLAEERRRRWAGQDGSLGAWLLAPDLRPFALDDPYATEARRHLEARNEAAERGRLVEAAAENAILERWYAPFVDATGTRRGDLGPAPEGPFRSRALAHLWTRPGPAGLWALVGLAAGLLALAGRVARRVAQGGAAP